MKTLAKEFGLLQVDKVGPVYTLDTSLSNSNWRQLSPGGGSFIANTYFDLAGLAMDDMTLFFEGAAMQEILPPSITVGTAGDLINIIDIMCTTPLTDNEVFLYGTYANIIGAGSALTFDQTIYGRVRTFNMDLDNLAGGYFITIGDNQTGSLEATASDRIYCYRLVAISATADSTIAVTGARYLLRTSAKEEPEYQYLMRLKRSYELQNQPDRD
jgi:hypothetical protein